MRRLVGFSARNYEEVLRVNMGLTATPTAIAVCQFGAAINPTKASNSTTNITLFGKLENLLLIHCNGSKHFGEKVG
jgi:hypothetical protein